MIFELWLCTCDCAIESHDDGFGCTEPGCNCLAGWTFDNDYELFA